MVNKYKLGFTCLQLEILRLLFIKTGTQLNQHQLATLLDVSQPAIKKALPGLGDLITITKDQDTKRFAITLNTDNHRALQLKRADNLRQIYDTGLADKLATSYAGATIILFGSYARGDDTTRSDIDLAIIGREPQELNLTTHEQLLERPININHYPNLKQLHKHLRENLCNGIILAGGIEL